jgi:hypothetical protein
MLYWIPYSLLVELGFTSVTGLKESDGLKDLNTFEVTGNTTKEEIQHCKRLLFYKYHGKMRNHIKTYQIENNNLF